jgi:hypothetical protein
MEIAQYVCTIPLCQRVLKHALARIFYQMWSTQQSYQDLGADYYEKRYREQRLHHLQRQAAKFGFDLVERSDLEAHAQSVS